MDSIRIKFEDEGTEYLVSADDAAVYQLVKADADTTEKVMDAVAIDMVRKVSKLGEPAVQRLLSIGREFLNDKQAAGTPRKEV